MTRKEALTKAGYVPRLGRPQKYNDKLDCRINLFVTQKDFDKLPQKSGTRTAFIRELIAERFRA